MALSQTRSSNRRSAKLHRTYREPDSESDLEKDIPQILHRPARSSRRIQTYREDSTSDQEQSTSSTPQSTAGDSTHTRLSRRQYATSNKKRNYLRRSQRKQDHVSKHDDVPVLSTLDNFKRQKVKHTSHSDTKVGAEILDRVAMMPVNVCAPPWQTLEYHILLKIMHYASFPLYTSAFRSQPSIEWLVGVSRLSKSFHDAAMAALCWKPPLLPVSRARGLIAILSEDQGQMSVNYRTKIKCLDIEVKHLLVKKSGVCIEDLIKHAPLLDHLRIYHWHDEMVGKAIWAEPSFSHFKWCYGSLFHRLDESNIRLKSFEWNGRFQDTMCAMQSAHTQACMSSVKELVIVNFSFTGKQDEERLRTREGVCSALSSLQNLEGLVFRNCTILDTTMMVKIPRGLRYLKITDCLSLTSEAVTSYLEVSGDTMRELHLEGNQVMDLAFIPRLAELCPHLEHLHIDLSYEDCSSYRDRNPLYDELLPHGGPTWPHSLISIVIGPLRSLEISEAENFYISLIDAAAQLPYLRMLSIKTILNNASWRDRAHLRAKWRPLFEKVFAANKRYIPTVSRPASTKSKSFQRKSARLQELEDVSLTDGTNESEDIHSTSVPLFRQNRCEVVDFELSDQRPAQEQFREDDFLDSERSGDDEWNGRDQVVTRPTYAWRP